MTTAFRIAASIHAVLAFAVCYCVGATQTATMVVTGKSFQLQPSNPLFEVGYGNVYTFFSTFNGTYGSLLIDTASQAVSGEVRPRSGSPGVYEGGYGQQTLLQAVDYGSFALTAPTTDSDGDGVLDFLQLNRPGSAYTSGSGYSMFAGAPFSISVTISRSAGSATGTYSATTQISGSAPRTVTGAFSIIVFNGSANYARGQTNTLAASLVDPASGRVLTGETTYTVGSGGNSLTYAAFNLTSSDGVVYRANAGTLTRSGSDYRGTLNLVDGAPQTYWADFRDYWVAITDAKDSDADGIPDLTDVVPAPVITQQPQGQTMAVGSTVVFTVEATGTGLTYQWHIGSTVIPGATSSRLMLTNISTAATANFTVTITNPAGGYITSNPAALTVITTTTPGRVVNLSVRSAAGSGAQTLITGFVISGDGSKALLLRGMGPALLPFGVVTAMTDPVLRLFNAGGTQVAANDDWGGTVALTDRFNALVGWVPSASSKDAALYSTMASGAYTFHVVANTGSPGVTLAELYDAESTEGSAKVVNISARTQVGTAENILIAGFVITGSTARTMLIRGLGPTLTGYGVEGVLADPQLNLYQASTLVSSNNDWAGAQVLKDAFNNLGAVPLVADTSKDAALLITLAPGIYSAQVSGVNSTTGVGLVEIFLMP